MKEKMKYIYKICVTAQLGCYIFSLYQLWHLCQYGGLYGHVSVLFLGLTGFVITFILGMVLRRYAPKEKSEGQTEKKRLHITGILFIAATVFFGGKMIYAAIPYHGALSWKLDEWMRKKEVTLEHNNLYEYGMEGVLTDLDKALDIPEELYIANKCQVTFDENGTVQSIYTFLYGKNKAGEKKTYLIDYDVNKSTKMTVWIAGHANGSYEEEMRLMPMLRILEGADWENQVKGWSEQFAEGQIYELLYFGRRGFHLEEGLRYVPGDADGDGIISGSSNFAQLNAGGEMVGFEVSLHIPQLSDVTPVRYMMEPEYISQAELKQENEVQQIDSAKETEGWTVDRSDETTYFFLDDRNGWRLVVADVAAGSRFYRMERTIDGGMTWEVVNEDPFSGQLGVAEGLLFYDENVGFAGLTGASRSYSALFITVDGGETFDKIELPMDMVMELPESAEEYGYTIVDYDYLNMPQRDSEGLTIMVMTEEDEKDGILFLSEDDGVTWKYNAIVQN